MKAPSLATVVSIIALVTTILGGFYAWAAKEGATQLKLELFQRDLDELKSDVRGMRSDMNGVRSEILNWMSNQDTVHRRGRETPGDYVAPEYRDRRPNGGN